MMIRIIPNLITVVRTILTIITILIGQGGVSKAFTVLSITFYNSSCDI